MRRPVFIAALIQLMAAVISFRCMGIGTGNKELTVLVACLIGVISFGFLTIYIRLCKISVFYYLVFLLYPITVIEMLVMSTSLNRNYGYEKFTGTVADIACKDSYMMVYMKKNSLNPRGIIVYADYKYIAGSDKEYLCTGDEIMVAGDVNVWDTAHNPGNFDSRLYYTSCGYPYKCTADDVKIIKSDTQSYKACLYRLKQRFKKIYADVFDEDDRKLMDSMILGDKYELDSDIKEAYQKSGMSHLLAISGLHISIVGMGIYKGLRKKAGICISAFAGIIVILSYLIFTGESVSASRAAVMLIITIVADIRARTYDMLTAISVASIMQILDNPYVVCNVSYIMSFLAVLGITLVLPVIQKENKTLIFIEKKNRKNRTFKDEILYVLCDSISVCMAIHMTLLPVMLYISYETAMISILLNCIVIPLMPVVMISGMATGITGVLSVKCAMFTGGAASYVLKFYQMVCKAADSFSGLIYVTGRPQNWQIILYVIVLCIWIMAESEYVGYFVNNYTQYYMKNHTQYYVKNYVKNHIGNYMLFNRKCCFPRNNKQNDICNSLFVNKLNRCSYSRIRAAVMLLMVVLAMLNMRYVPHRGLYIMMLDVGQGDCIYIRDMNGVSYLFDGGSTDVKNSGKYRIYPALRSMGIKRLDYVIISHSDADHINGIKELIDMCDESFTIGEVVMPDIKDKEEIESYAGMTEYVKKAGITITYSVAGDVLLRDDTSSFDITCIHPCKSYDYEDVNDFSAVYRINYGDFSMMMMGDSGKKAEKCIMNDWNKTWHTSVLKTGHHGSKYSTGDDFLTYISPVVSVISCGRQNRYGHPHNETLERLRDKNIEVYRTDEGGAITIKVSEDSMVIEQKYN